MPRPIVIDTDPGTDDAVAILLALASPELEVLGLVAVAGNVPLAATERNARAVLELAGRPDIPVYAGCPRPLGPATITAEHVHGATGLGQLVLPPPATPLQSRHGVDFLIETLGAAPPHSVTLCALGPLTNIATALIMMPGIADGIAELVVMGGASYALGNMTPAAEFNIYADPDAAAAVFASGVPITMVPLDVTHQVPATAARIAAMRGIGNRSGLAAASLIEPRRARGSGTAAEMSDAPLHDPCVIAYLSAPELFDGSQVNVAIETRSPLTMGMTVVDWRGVSGRTANARVLTRVDADGFYALLTERLGRLP